MRWALLSLWFIACSGGATPAPSRSAVAPTAPTETEVVHIDTGLVRGMRAGETLAWKGIPYAAPPIGPLRWRPPAPPAAWDGVRDATGFGYECVQAGTSSDPTGTPTGSEDCLTLNVWRPASGGSRPVMVFVHGGYFTWGSSSYRLGGVDLYDGAFLATAGDVVVVTINYRLGPFGFLAHPGLADEDPHHASGNDGLLDQIAALHWVQRNIAAFGGDPKSVTLFGQSAGAISSAALYASPLARGLFHRVILHSGTGDAIATGKSHRAGLELAKRLACERATAAETIACLRDKSPMAIATAVPESYASDGIKYGPAIDGWVLPDRPLSLVEQGEHSHVPIIVSTTATEFSTMVHNYVDGPISTPADFSALAQRRFGAKFGPYLVAHYPATAYATPLQAYIAILSDAAFACQSDWLADAAASKQTEPVYRFVYAHHYSGTLARFGAGHGMDLYMIFRNTPPFLTLDDAERALSDRLIAVWSRFAHGADVEWTKHTRDGNEQMMLDSDIHAATDPAELERCKLWWPVIHDRR
jgi:para-nitrobenzyl esterase